VVESAREGFAAGDLVFNTNGWAEWGLMGEGVALLEGEGCIVDAHYYPNEGHGFVKRENQIDALERTIAWFEWYLKPAK
jgi:Prolyl oligopeptidase family